MRASGNRVKTIQEWQDHLRQVYPNSERTPDYMMTHLYTACSDIGRMLLRHEGGERRDRAVMSALSWMMALSNHFGVSFEDSLLSRFPAVCYYCLSGPCRCDETGRRAIGDHGEVLSRDEADYERQVRHDIFRRTGLPVTFKWLIGTLRAVYPGNRILLTKGGQGYVTGKLLEEGGELHRAYSEVLLKKADKSRVSEELADLASWIISCWALDGTPKSLDAEFHAAYGNHCPICSKLPCVCEVYTITPGQDELLRQIASELKRIENTAIDKEEVGKLVEFAEQAIIDPSPANKRSLVDGILGFLALNKSKLDNGKSEVANGAAPDINEIGDLAESLTKWI